MSQLRTYCSSNDSVSVLEQCWSTMSHNFQVAMLRHLLMELLIEAIFWASCRLKDSQRTGWLLAESIRSICQIIACSIMPVLLVRMGQGSVLPCSSTKATSSSNCSTKGKTSASKKTAQAKTTGEPQSDADIQSCITKRLAAAPKLKTQGLSATVSEGVATFIGTAANPGSKGGVYSLAKSCGAKQIVNHITVQASGKSTAKAVTPAKPAQGESPKKP